MLRILFVVLLLAMNSSYLKAGEPSFLQYFYSVKKVLPGTKTIGVFIDEGTYKNKETQIKRAAKQTNLQAKIYLITDTKSIGKYIKQLQDVDVLLVYTNPVLNQKSSRLFILSRTKSLNIPIVSSSEEYSNAGAFLYIFKGENQKTQLVVNLKQTPYLANRFGEEATKKMGISKLIR